MPDAERASAFGSAHFFLTDNAQLYAELSYSRSKQETVIQPAPISDQFALPNGHPLARIQYAFPISKETEPVHVPTKICS